MAKTDPTAADLFATANKPLYVYVDAFDLWVTSDGRSAATEAEAIAHVHSAVVQGRVASFMQYVDANVSYFFSKPAKPERTKRDGTVVPATGGLMSPGAREAKRTRLEKDAALVFGWLATSGQ
jgi:hypothetical protein